MIVIYGSRYGSAGRYAQEFARRVGAEAVPAEAVKRIPAGEEVVFFGGVYAGGVRGLRRAAKKIAAGRGRLLAVATVGLADPADGKNAENLRRGVLALLPEPLRGAHIFHLRGSIDYAKLSRGHRFLMGLLYAFEKCIPPERRSAESRAVVETYGGAADFVDLAALAPVLAAVGAGEGQN